MRSFFKERTLKRAREILLFEQKILKDSHLLCGLQFQKKTSLLRPSSSPRLVRAIIVSSSSSRSRITPSPIVLESRSFDDIDHRSINFLFYFTILYKILRINNFSSCDRVIIKRQSFCCAANFVVMARRAPKKKSSKSKTAHSAGELTTDDRGAPIELRFAS